jgi:hypothetical protein
MLAQGPCRSMPVRIAAVPYDQLSDPVPVTIGLDQR